MLLFINACVRPASRTKRLADRLLSRLEGPIRETRLHELALPRADAAFLEERDALLRRGNFGHPLFALARDFAADEIVLAVPYWDLSFPSSVKAYLEQITVTGLTFSYGEDGLPRGHCRARRLWYVMTAGGPILPPNHGYRSCLDVAAENGCDSIAFCCISTGVFGFPKREAAEIAVQTVKDWKTGKNSAVKVIFNVFGDEDLAIYRRILQ